MEVDTEDVTSKDGGRKPVTQDTLKLYIHSKDLRRLSNRQLAERINKLGLTKELEVEQVDKIPWKAFAFISFKAPSDAVEFAKVFDGFVLRQQQLRVNAAVPQIEGEEEKTRRAKRKREPSTEDVPVFFDGRRPPLPVLLEFKKRRLDIHASLCSRVTPLASFSYPDQLVMKHQFIRTAMKRFTKSIYEACTLRHAASLVSPLPVPRWCTPKFSKGFHGVPVDQTISAPPSARVGYRNKCEFTVGFTDGNSNCDGRRTDFDVGFVVGIVNEEPQVASCSGCLHVPLSMQEVAFALKELIARHREEFPVYSRRRHEGLWRIAMVRASAETKELLVSVQIKGPVEEELQGRVKKLLVDELVFEPRHPDVLAVDPRHQRRFDGMTISSLFLQIRDAVSDTTDQDPHIPVWGKHSIEQRLLGLKFSVQPTSFFQTNSLACESLYSKAFDLLNASSDATVLDICCGTGTIGLCLARRQPNVHVIGIDVVAEAIEDAKKNANANSICSVEYTAGKAEDVLPPLLSKIAKERKTTEGCCNTEVCAIVDPPRGGLHSTVLAALRDCTLIEKLVYISCNADSFTTNAVVLCTPTPSNSRPFVPTRAVPMDMFPHTTHCELIVVFRRATEEDFGTLEVEPAGVTDVPNKEPDSASE